VLMADGTTKAIKYVKVGDRVKATDPKTGKTTVRTVTKLHRNQDTDLTDLTVKVGHAKAELHTTTHHPFWDATARAWINAADLRVGHHLRTDDGKTVTVARVHSFVDSKQMLDLTVANVHTYYVLAGNTPVLVHNCGKQVYEAGGKHGPQARGSVRGPNSAEPTNGQGALGNSVQIKPTSPRRIGIDPSTGEPVILDRTGEVPCGCSQEDGVNEIFHGHVRTDIETDKGMVAARNALRRAIKNGGVKVP
jgi:hypothetical protein